jgi:hypothetical protein
MPIDWESIEPVWVRVLGRGLPDDLTEIYLSAPDDGITSRKARLLGVSPSGLYGAQVEALFDNRGRWETNVTIERIPLAVTQAIHIQFEAGEQWTRGYQVRISLDRDLPEFGDQVTLPLNPEDYGGREESQEAARRFAGSLLSLWSTP